MCVCVCVSAVYGGGGWLSSDTPRVFPVFSQVSHDFLSKLLSFDSCRVLPFTVKSPKVTFSPFPPRAGLVRNDLLTGYRDVRKSLNGAVLLFTTDHSSQKL